MFVALKKFKFFGGFHPILFKIRLFINWFHFKGAHPIRDLTCLCDLINPLNAELNPICHLLALLEVHHFLHVSRIRVKSLALRLLMSYIYIYI